MPDESPKPDAAPKVDGTVANAGVGIGWGVRQIALSLTGDGGIRFLAICVIASFTWVATWSVTRYTEMQTSTQSMLVRVGEERIEREKGERARAEREWREWMSGEMEKSRTSFSANISFVTKAFEAENERNRAMVFKLAGAKAAAGGPVGGNICPPPPERPDQ